MRRKSLSCVILLTWITFARCEFSSSVHQLTKLVDYERFILGKMEKFVSLNENKLDYLKEKLSELERNQEDALEDGDEYFENLINAYLLIKRFSLDWEKLNNILHYEIGASILKSNNYTFIDENDLNGALDGLLRLQKVYRLRAKDMVEGKLGSINYKTELSAQDCYLLGKRALNEGMFLLANAWLLESLKKSESYEPSVMDLPLDTNDLLEALAEAKFNLNDFSGATELTFLLNQLNPNDTRFLDLHNNYTYHQITKPSIKISKEHDPLSLDLSDINDDDTRYRLTCSEHIHQSPSAERKLRCGYLTETHPFLLLAPLKVEELSLDPLLLLFHEVIYDSEIKVLKDLANDTMHRASVVNGTTSYVSTVRTSYHAFFPTSTHKVFQTIDERVADMTDLNMETAEDHQIANYGIGGHYSQHFDFFVKGSMISNMEDGNRVATVLFYLSDVEQGGGTAFPKLKRLLKPKKGNAAFWYNLHTSGDGDEWSLHGACPVLVGSKWVLNRWIRERGQEFKRPCSLVDDATSTVFKF